MRPEPLPDDAAAEVRAARQVYVIRKRVLAECRRVQRLIELVGSPTLRRKGARWQVRRSKFA